MGPRKFAISIYPGVYTDQVDAIVDILQTIPDAKISLIGPWWEPFEGITSGESRTTRMLEPTDTFHNPPDEGIQVFIIPDGEQSYDDHRSFRDHLSRGGVLGFLRAISPQNVHSILTIGTSIVLPARAKMLAGKNAAMTPDNYEWFTMEEPLANWLETFWVRDEKMWSASGNDGALEMMRSLVETILQEEEDEKMAEKAEAQAPS